jgi:hypothetical protein
MNTKREGYSQNDSEAILANAKELDVACRSARELSTVFQKNYLLAEKESDFDPYSNYYWRNLIFREALVKLANVIENELRLITTFSVLTSARYVLEMLIWLRLINIEEDRYITWFIAVQIAERIQQTEDDIKQTLREREVYNKIADKQDRELMNLRNKSKRNVSRIQSKYDVSVSESFFVHESSARKGGFRRAFSLTESVIRELNRDLAELRKTRERAITARNQWPTEKWIWQKKAYEVNLNYEYDFIYGYISRLVHCKPASFVTNQKNLEASEIILFQRFLIFAVGKILRVSEGKISSN